MSANTVTIPIACWGDFSDLDLTFPNGWPVTHCMMKGHDTPEMSDQAIRNSLESPFGTPRLTELAEGRQRVVILFDDLIRPTPTYRIVPFVLDELYRAGIADDQIRFVAAWADDTR